MSAQPIFGLDAPTGDARHDASIDAGATTARIIVAFIGVNLVRSRASTSNLASYRFDGIERLLEALRIVRVRRRNQGRERDALPVNDDVVFATGFPAVDRVGTRESPPFCAGITDASRAARSKASLSSLFSAANNACQTESHTPASCHATSRRQHVIPDP